MSENSELIHRHLQPRSVALLVDAVAANGAQTASNLVCSSAVSVTGLGERLMKEAGPFYWFNLYLSRFVPFRGFKICFYKPDLAKKALALYCDSI